MILTSYTKNRRALLSLAYSLERPFSVGQIEELYLQTRNNGLKLVDPNQDIQDVLDELVARDVLVKKGDYYSNANRSEALQVRGT